MQKWVYREEKVWKKHTLCTKQIIRNQFSSFYSSQKFLLKIAKFLLTIDSAKMIYRNKRFFSLRCERSRRTAKTHKEWRHRVLQSKSTDLFKLTLPWAKGEWKRNGKIATDFIVHSFSVYLSDEIILKWRKCRPIRKLIA